MASFDPYHKWLAIPPEEQPPNHYRLLALPLFESDSDVIEAAAEQRTVFLRSFQTGPNAEIAERLLNEVSEARVCLLDGKSKARYDQQLQATLEPVQPPELPVAETVPGEAPLPLVASGPRSVSRSSAGKPIWQQPWAAVTAGAVGLIVLLVVLNSSKPKMLAPANAVAPFDAKKAKQHQQDWAEYLDVSVRSLNSINMPFVVIPAGLFSMGSTKEEVDFLVHGGLVRKISTFHINELPGETPRHRVEISRPFLLSAYEVTQQQYERVMKDQPWNGKPDVKEGPEYPATWVSYDNAKKFCDKLSKQEGVGYRLPTEAEWEYACRAGTTTTYSFGDDVSKVGQHAWYVKNAKDIGEDYGHRVGEKLPNPWGLYDMHGNVSEWCQDWYGMYGIGTVITDPSGPALGKRRVLRSGCWQDHGEFYRSAQRDSLFPEVRYLRNRKLGFRVVKVISE